MPFQNATNPNNNDFQETSGVFEFADRTRMVAGYTENLGLTYTGSVLSVTGADSALSSTNPGYVILSSKSSPGLLKKYKITADQGFIDDTGASEIIGNRFGTDAGVAWANTLPFFIYAVLNDAEDAIAFMISRIPHTAQSPTAANIGAPDDPVANDEQAFFSFDNIDETLYESNPCRSIGSFRMTKTSSDDWTVAALSKQDNIGSWQEGSGFTMPFNQNGAAVGTYFKANGGTAPTFTTNEYYFGINRHGNIAVTINLEGDGGTDGAGAVNTIIALPYQVASFPAAFSRTPNSGFSMLVRNSSFNEANYAGLGINTTDLYLYRIVTSLSQLANWGAGSRNVLGHFIYNPPGLP